MGGGRIVPSLPSFHDPVFGFHVEEVWDSCGLYLIGAVGAGEYGCGLHGCRGMYLCE